MRAVFGVFPVSVAVYGTPDETDNVGAIVNPETTVCSAPSPDPDPGLHTALATNRCRISQFELP